MMRCVVLILFHLVGKGKGTEKGVRFWGSGNSHPSLAPTPCPCLSLCPCPIICRSEGGGWDKEVRKWLRKRDRLDDQYWGCCY